METNEKELTGYPSIDKPWEKYYRDTPLRYVDVNKTIYENMFLLNKDNMEYTALGFIGAEMTFQELKDKVDTTASALIKSGIKHGDVILIGVPICPEAAVFALAINKIGAVSRWFDLRCAGSDIQMYSNESNCNLLVILDMAATTVEEIINNTTIKTVIMINPTDSLSLIAQKLYGIKNKTKKIKDPRFFTYKKFMEENKSDVDVPIVKYEHKRPAIMLQSSGTTGKPKIIVHTDYSVNNMVKSMSYTDLPNGLGKSLFTVIPPWVAYGLVGGMLEPMMLGTKIEMFPTLEPASIYNNIGKFTSAVAVPIHLRYLYDNYTHLPKAKKELLSNVDCLVSGGDKMTIEENSDFEKTFGTKVVNGYGNSECLGGITCNPLKCNKYGTVGIPKYGDIVSAFNTETGKECQYNEVGELCVITGTMFLCYHNNTEETNNIKHRHEDGRIWMHTGDLCSIDEDGYVTLHGRVRRVITRAGFKISAYLIEQKICECEKVKECVVVEVNDTSEEHVPMAFVVLKDNIEELAAKQEIKEICNRDLKKHEIPKYILFDSELPYTKNGKYNILELENRGNILINSIDDSSEIIL